MDLPRRLHAGKRSRERPANRAWIPPENLRLDDFLRSSPQAAAQAPLLLRRDRLLRAARRRRDQRTPQRRPGELLCRNVSRLIPQPWNRTRPILMLPTADAANRRISQDISGPLSGKPASTTSAPASPFPPGQHRNRPPVFITGVTDIPGFLTWLRFRCPRALPSRGSAKT